MADMERDTRLTFRMPQATRDALERAAAAERRTLAALVVVVIDDWLAAHGYLKPPGRAKRVRGKG